MLARSQKAARTGRFGLSWTPGATSYLPLGQQPNPSTLDHGNRWQPATTTYTGKRIFEATPAVCGDGRHFVYLSYRAGTPHIWRSKLDGSDARQLTNGAGEFLPSCSPDGTWLTYGTSDPKSAGIWRMSIDGGNPIRLWERSGASLISPDGKWVAIVDLDRHPAKAMLIPAEGGKPVKSFSLNLEHFLPVGWTPDGRALLWLKNANEVMNVWQTNLDFGEAKQLTRFGSELIDSAYMSRDGKKLAVARYSSASDVVLIKDLDAK